MALEQAIFKTVVICWDSLDSRLRSANERLMTFLGKAPKRGAIKFKHYQQEGIPDGYVIRSCGDGTSEWVPAENSGVTHESG